MRGSVALFLLPLFVIYKPGAQELYAQDNTRYVCRIVDRESGNCLSWEEVNPKNNLNNSLGHRQPSYENDYRIPPTRARTPLFQGVPSGSSFMPSTEYAPSIGSGIPPVGKR